MAKNPTALLDTKGFSLVTQFEQANDEADASEGKKKERVCGDDAVRRVRDLLTNLRYKLSQGDDQDPWLTCKGMQCDLRAEGEWSVWVTLYFRQSHGQVVLESWTGLESALLDPAEVSRRTAFLRTWRVALAGTPCPP